MKKRWIIGIIIFILIMSVIAVLYIKKSPSNESSANQDLIERIQSGDKSGEWQIYTNEEFGFEVKYPPYGFITADNWRFSKDSGYYTIELRVPNTPTSGEAFTIDISPNDGKNLKEYASSAISLAEYSDKSTITDIYVNGVPAVKIVLESAEGFESRSVILIEEDAGYSIKMLGPDFKDAEEILTTFKFFK